MEGKSAAVLRSNGSLAVFSNRHIRQGAGFFLRVQDIYRTFAPSMVRTVIDTDRHCGKPAGRELFGEPVIRSYEWAIEYSAKEYTALLGTYSDHINLPAAERRDLFSAIEDLIDRECSGKVLKHYGTVLRFQKKI